MVTLSVPLNHVSSDGRMFLFVTSHLSIDVVVEPSCACVPWLTFNRAFRLFKSSQIRPFMVEASLHFSAYQTLIRFPGEAFSVTVLKEEVGLTE